MIDTIFASLIQSEEVLSIKGEYTKTFLTHSYAKTYI